MINLIVITFSLIVLLLFGIMERQKNKNNIKKIPIRININGIRGKSTITRLTTAILAEAGYETIGKTTGTAPRIIHNHSKEEIEIDRSPRGVNIIEQVEIIDYAADKIGAEVLVSECMAVNPEYQKVYQEEMLHANVGVIVNVQEDHMNVMGPTLDEVALAFTSTIPYDGLLIIQDNHYSEYFTEIAKERNTKVFIADENNIPKDYSEQFNFILFPNNIAIPLAIAKALDIDKKIALNGMLKVNPDPGALQLHKVNYKDSSFTFINGLAVNDPESVLEAWDLLIDKEVIDQNSKPVVLFNGRSDRVDRTRQFTKDCIPHIPNEIQLIAIGEELHDFQLAFDQNKMPNVIEFYNFENRDTEDVFKEIAELTNGQAVIAIGNIHGHGYELLDYIYEFEGEKNGIY